MPATRSSYFHLAQKLGQHHQESKQPGVGNVHNLQAGRKITKPSIFVQNIDATQANPTLPKPSDDGNTPPQSILRIVLLYFLESTIGFY